VLRRQPKKNDNPFVFSSDMVGRPIQSIQQVWQRVRAEANLDGVRLHDLRHSFASFAAANGASLPIIGRMLGHSTPLTTQRYAHLVQDPVRDANEAVGAAIGQLMCQTTSGSAPVASCRTAPSLGFMIACADCSRR